MIHHTADDLKKIFKKTHCSWKHLDDKWQKKIFKIFCSILNCKKREIWAKCVYQ